MHVSAPRSIVRRHHWVAVAVFGVFATAVASAAVPASEREALLAIYQEAGGDGWTDHEGWGGAPGTECTWQRVLCDGSSSHVTGLALQGNHLVGTLPPLSALTELQLVNFDTNELTGPIPALSALTELVSFGVEDNHFTGSLPALAGLVHLQEFSVANNDLSGPIPPLSGLVALTHVFLNNNHLTGPIPDLAGLIHLDIFNAENNQLTGITSLAGLTSLTYLRLGNNRLEGPIPSLDGLQNLLLLFADHNHLSGPLPSLASLTHAVAIVLDHNALSGPIPDPPNPSSLSPGVSTLCPNGLTPSANPDTNAAWDTYTGRTPWNEHCAPTLIFGDTFDGDD